MSNFISNYIFLNNLFCYFYCFLFILSPILTVLNQSLLLLLLLLLASLLLLLFVSLILLLILLITPMSSCICNACLNIIDNTVHAIYEYTIPSIIVTNYLTNYYLYPKYIQPQCITISYILINVYNTVCFLPCFNCINKEYNC